jgi:hypothetical protein|tara:strand:- start:3397 stop:3852 length:456 start_codon:yes stop_codon:yes gene_type:complete
MTFDLHRRDNPSYQLGELDMTKVNNSSTLIELKLAVINYHDGENMNYLQKNIARDACYTSNNSLTYKKKQMADGIADFESAMVEGRDILAERLCQRIEAMEIEFEELVERHEADKAVYLVISDGEEWAATKPTNNKSKLTSKLAAIKARVA